MLTHRLGRAVIQLASALALLALVAGLPIALTGFVGWPLPSTVPTDWAGWSALLTGGFPDTAVINLLAVALWLAWAAFCYSLIGEVVAVRRGRPARHVRVISPMQALAALLIAGLSTAPAAASVAIVAAPPPAVSQTVPAAAPTNTTASPDTADPAAGTLPWLNITTQPNGASGTGSATSLVVTIAADTGSVAAPTANTSAATLRTSNPSAGLPRFAAVAHTGPLTLTAGGQQYTVTVQRGDTLWEIAEAWLGDPHRWPEIYKLNADRYDDHGRMRGGDHIEPTWVLVLPDDATPPPGAQPAPPPGSQSPPGAGEDPGQPAAPPSTAPPSTAPPSTAPPSTAPSTIPPSTAAPGTHAPGDDGVFDPPGASTSGPAASGAASTAPAPAGSDGTAAPTADDGRDDTDGGVALLSGSWLDVGLALAVIAAAALVWAHRRRRYTPRPPTAQPRLDDPDLAPMPPVVTGVRRGLRERLRRAVPQPQSANDDLGLFSDDPETPHRHLDGDDGFAGPEAAVDPITALPRFDLDLDEDDYDHEDDEDDEDDDSSYDDGDRLYVRDLIDDDIEADSGPHPDADDDEVGSEPEPEPVPVVPALTNPVMAVWPPAGLGLTGPRAEDAARGFLAAALAAGGVDEPDARTHVVMPSATAATLLGAAAVGLPDTPRLTITGGLDEALELLEAQTLNRTRLVYRHEVDTVAELRAADPLEEPVEPLLLLADATTGHARARIAALLAQGQRLDIHGVLLGVWPDGNTVVVNADGTTRPRDGDHARHGHHPGDIGRLAVLTPAETADLIALLAESHTGLPPAPAPTEPQPAPVVSGTAAAQPAASGGAILIAEQPDPASTSSSDAPPPSLPVPSLRAPDLPPGPPDASNGRSHPAPAHPDAPSGAATNEVAAGADDPDTPREQDPQARPDLQDVPVDPGPDHRSDAPDEPETPVAPRPQDEPEVQDEPEAKDEPAEAPAEAGTAAADLDSSDSGQPKGRPPRVVRVRVLGQPEIVDMDTSKGGTRRKSMEVLVYLAVHDGQIHYEAILDDVLPDAAAKRAPHRLHTYVSALRDVLRRTGGAGEYVPRLRERYTLNRDLLDVDLWRMQHALREAEQATDPAVKVAAWRRAVDEYRGDLAEDSGYEWLEPYREAARQQVLDAVLALADALTDQPTEAADILETALTHSPYTEALYQAAMRAHAARRDIEAVRRLRRTLTQRLAEIDTEPAEETTALADQLIARLQAPPRRTGPRPAADPGEDAAA
ncbi:BTAD domain-containing putative transcriptional regulator [Dactylosporangium vinaceum]|uniref:BTAD domain-containing putative transcriptional regulator n=1 Tax=Dactylosporangium vinaceum TaxID=53362 RepID=A0ABV5M2D6_9ACTN|nr:BTAD domain-containing putative transcriptional regulator [Dactylosporangium vinaceum]